MFRFMNLVNSLPESADIHVLASGYCKGNTGAAVRKGRANVRVSQTYACGWRIVNSRMIPRDSPSCYDSAMRNLAVLFIEGHFCYGQQKCRLAFPRMDGTGERRGWTCCWRSWCVPLVCSVPQLY